MESSDSKKNFFKHVFNFEDDSKSEMLNIIQYSLMAIVPVIILNKTMQKYVPEADEQKGSLEILAEIIIQIIGMFIGLLLVHRAIIFVPAYSGMEYPEFNVIFNILAVLMITLSLQTKLGEKVGLLVDRLTELWEGKSDKKDKNKKKGTVKVTQPISQNGQQAAMGQSMYNDGTSISSLPTNDSSQYTTSPQQLPNYNTMHQPDSTPLQNAASPSDQSEGFSNFPMAANEALGGSFGGSSW